MNTHHHPPLLDMLEQMPLYSDYVHWQFTWCVLVCNKSFFLIGGFNPSEKCVSWDHYSQYMDNNPNVPNHRPVFIFSTQHTSLEEPFFWGHASTFGPAMPTGVLSVKNCSRADCCWKRSALEFLGSWLVWCYLVGGAITILKNISH